jgi:calcineurin-like phosphoesterase family protein
MNETIITNWNNVVGKDDLVYHLGDFAFGKQDYHLTNILDRLSGSIILIKGNHDRLAWSLRHKFYASYDTYHEIEVEGKTIVLNHYAQKVWNKSHYGSYHLYGHSHGTLPDNPHALSIDIGVDCHNFTPISFEQVKVIMSKKLFKPIDHHVGNAGKSEEEGGIGLSKEDYAKADRRRMYEQLRQEFEIQPDKNIKVPEFDKVIFVG